MLSNIFKKVDPFMRYVEKKR